MSGGELLVATDELQLLTHERVIRVGEALQRRYDEDVEDDRRRAVRCTEEVVRREEARRHEGEQAAAEEHWRRERQELFREAHQGQLRAIAKHNGILERKLRSEFAEALAKVQEESQQHLEGAIQRTWQEANDLQRQAVEEARREGRARAREEAEREAARVAIQRRDDVEEAERDKEAALEEQRERLGEVKRRALSDHENSLREEFRTKLAEVCESYDVRLGEVEAECDKRQARIREVEGELVGMRTLRDEWESKCESTKKEFSDFIDQFPGFRGEFLLK